MCSLSAAALFVTPTADDITAEKNAAAKTTTSTTAAEIIIDDPNLRLINGKGGGGQNSSGVRDDDEEKSQERTVLEHIVYTNHVAGTSLLVSWGFCPKWLSDSYAACCAASFYSSVCAMGLSAVVNAWLACTPPGGTAYFVRYHSLIICSIPGFLALSTGLAGIALFLGIDRSKGTPVSYIGLAGTAVGGLLIGTATVRGMVCTYRLLTPLVKKMQ
jgi:hypothetical protein